MFSDRKITLKECVLLEDEKYEKGQILSVWSIDFRE